MTDSFVTQCPHCQTRFRVSYNQLGVARGAVRCGACKQVFNAARQLLEQSAEQQAQPQAPLPPAAEIAAAQALQAAPMAAEHATPKPINQAEWQASQLEALDLDDELARLERRPAAEPPGTSLNARRDLPDEHWPEQPFGNHADDHIDPAQGLVDAEEAPVLGEPPLLDDDERPEPRFSALPSDPLGDLDTPLKKDPEARRDALTAREDEDEDEDDHEAPTPPAPLARKGKPVRTEPNLRTDHLHGLEDDPLQLQWQRTRSSFGKRLLWGGLSLLAALALLGQYVLYHYDELARQDQYRPWFQTLCPLVGCKLPSKVDVGLIKSSNLVVRSHPEFAGALVVDAIIYNRAPFSQPFPMLELRFADLNGQLLASRRFKPAEYLAGDLAGQAEMPSQTPIHIALDILDPGPKAVNYSLSFRSPE